MHILQQWWVAFAASSVSVVSGHLLIKAGLNALVPLPAGTALTSLVLHVLLQPQLLAGLVIYLVGTIFWMRAVSQKEISFLYPLSSVNYVLVAAISVAIFHEVMSARRTAGVLVIVFGMILMTRQSSRKAL
jgi:drug/metabolite transporter (DMT)-like permease